MHKVLVNRLIKLAQEKCVVRGNDPPNMTIAVDLDIKHQTKLKNLVQSFLLNFETQTKACCTYHKWT